MPNARHPKKYPDGEGLPVTPAWKASVRSALAENKRNGRKPDTVASLARMIDADKSGVTKMLKSNDSEKTKYAQPIMQVLGVEPAMISNPQLTDDELDRIVGKIRGLPLRKHEYAMDQLRLLVRMLDES